MSTTAASAVAAATEATAFTDIIPKSVITIGILVLGFALGFIIAKLANYCYHRADVPDNASDISDHTKGLLRIQLAMLKFGKRGQPQEDPEEAKREQQAMVLNMWKMKAMNKAQQAEADKEAAAEQTVKSENEKPAAKSTDGNKKGGKQESSKSSGAAASATAGGTGGKSTPSGTKAANGSANKPATTQGSASKPAASGGQARPTTAKPKKLFPNTTTISVGPKTPAPAKGKAQAKESGDNAQSNGQTQQKQSRPTTASTNRRESRNGTPRSSNATAKA